MKAYRNSLKQVGKRGFLIDPKNPPKVQAIVEYGTGMDSKSVSLYAWACLKKLFPEYDGIDPIFRENSLIIGWVRVFVGDDMIDISYQKLKSFLKK